MIRHIFYLTYFHLNFRMVARLDTSKNVSYMCVILPTLLTKTFQTLIKEMNRLGMIVDLSHSSVQVIKFGDCWNILKSNCKPLSFVADSPRHSGDLCCPCDFLSLICSSIVQLCAKCTWPTPQADGNSFYIFGRRSIFSSGSQEGPGDDQLLLLLHNLFKCFIYNRCDRWVANIPVDGKWFDSSQHISTTWGRWLALTLWA